MTGQTDYLLWVAAADAHDLREFVVEHLASDPAVSHAETSLIYEQRRGPGVFGPTRRRRIDPASVVVCGRGAAPRDEGVEGRECVRARPHAVVLQGGGSRTASVCVRIPGTNRSGWRCPE